MLPLAVDVTDAAARDKAVADTLARFGRIDVLANLAGRGVAGACEEFSLEQLREQMELNFFAAAEMTRAVLPQMRRQGSGNVITVSSIAGLVAMNAAGLLRGEVCPRRLDGVAGHRGQAAGDPRDPGRARRLPHRIRRRREHAADAAHRGLPPVDCTV